MYTRALLSARNAVKATVSRRGMGSVTDFKPPTMSELPVPQGAWKDAHNAKQRKNNLHLISGVLVAGGTLSFVSFV
ncbi:hypothetical protein E2C01_009432 [Portunus trituberculatus]|uniref:Deltamethrin resistance protein prag01 domain-containing protein n=1 Tax=Portunus trituberculatus TaxID=210409 RepID=A0A5B7D5S7_PORTR|nr:hypothetical protein [Portunus trituberculatus]